MAISTSKYSEIEYAIDEENEVLTILGKKIEIIKDEKGLYLSKEMPYQRFDSLHNLAEEIIKCSPDHK